ncbi:MAG TPA: septum site-determining protein Ssd [Mycobacteriales bacterium]|nr:septum site-determining protein Ssd [Mycobacteriales bacterium]
MAPLPDHTRLSAQGRPLIITADPELLEQLISLLASLGVEPTVVLGPGAAGPDWATARVVLVGADVAIGTPPSWPLPAREDVVVVAGSRGSSGPVAAALGAACTFRLPAEAAGLRAVLAAALSGAGRAACVGVIGGRGGAGASTLAAALALTGSRLWPSVLVDADPLGGGIDLILGAEAVGGLRWPDLSASRAPLNPAGLREALVRVDELRVLSWDRLSPPSESGAWMTAVLGGVVGTHQLVVVDLPRQIDSAALAALDFTRTVLVVVPADLRAAAAAGRVAAGLTGHCQDVRLVVRGPAPGGLDPAAIADALELPLAGSLRAEPGLAAALERGEPPGRSGRGPLAAFCRRLLAELIPVVAAA